MKLPKKNKLLWIISALAASALIFISTPPKTPPPHLQTSYEEKIKTPFTPLSQDQLLFDSNRTGNFEIFTMSTDGKNVQQLTENKKFDSWWPKISPNREQILFYRTPAGVHDTKFTDIRLWIANANDNLLKELIPDNTYGWDIQGHAEWSPDGERIVMFAGKKNNPQIFITDKNGGNPTQITDRPGTNIDPSWSSDGETIYFTGCSAAICFPEDYEIYALHIATNHLRRITDDNLRDHDPYVSPDNSQIAWLTQMQKLPPQWAISISSTTGEDKRYVIRDNKINSKPDWSPDGEYIYFHRQEDAGKGFQIFRIRPGGTDLRPLTKDHPGINEYPDI